MCTVPKRWLGFFPRQSVLYDSKVTGVNIQVLEKVECLVAPAK